MRGASGCLSLAIYRTLLQECRAPPPLVRADAPILELVPSCEDHQHPSIRYIPMCLAELFHGEPPSASEREEKVSFMKLDDKRVFLVFT
jgi:hypothetical protein